MIVFKVTIPTPFLYW